MFDAYGWPHDLTDEQILERLVALNHERAEEESRGLIRWLRPEFQNPSGQRAHQTQLPDEPEEDEEPQAKPVKAKKEPWPAALPDRIRAVRSALVAWGKPVAPADLAARFSRAKADTLEELLATLSAVGQARQLDDGRFVP